MKPSRRAGLAALVAAAVSGAALIWPAAAPADPADQPPPTTVTPAPGAPVPAAPPADPFMPYVPPIQNPQYGSGKNGGGVLGTLKDLWDQVKNPTLDQADSGRPTPPPGAGPAPALPPGYVSTNAPGSETAATAPAGGPATGRPALPPGYYSTSGPPPPGYQYTTPGAPVTTVPPIPPAS
jgi:hypothetical protein